MESSGHLSPNANWMSKSSMLCRSLKTLEQVFTFQKLIQTRTSLIWSSLAEMGMLSLEQKGDQSDKWGARLAPFCTPLTIRTNEVFLLSTSLHLIHGSFTFITVVNLWCGDRHSCTLQYISRIKLRVQIQGGCTSAGVSFRAQHMWIGGIGHGWVKVSLTLVSYIRLSVFFRLVQMLWQSRVT